jgi:Protein of unknown function (DUF732)
MKRLLATLAVALAPLGATVLTAMPSAHADTSGYIDCLNRSGVSYGGKSQDWWIRLGRAVATDSERGVYDAAIEQELVVQGGLSYRDAEQVLGCAVVTLK